MPKIDPYKIKEMQINSVIENPNMQKDDKITEIHKILNKTNEDLLTEYFYERLENKLFNFEETYSSLFRGSDNNENKKNK